MRPSIHWHILPGPWGSEQSPHDLMLQGNGTTAVLQTPKALGSIPWLSGPGLWGSMGQISNTHLGTDIGCQVFLLQDETLKKDLYSYGLWSPSY